MQTEKLLLLLLSKGTTAQAPTSITFGEGQKELLLTLGNGITASVFLSDEALRYIIHQGNKDGL